MVDPDRRRLGRDPLAGARPLPSPLPPARPGDRRDHRLRRPPPGDRGGRDPRPADRRRQRQHPRGRRRLHRGPPRPRRPAGAGRDLRRHRPAEHPALPGRRTGAPGRRRPRRLDRGHGLLARPLLHDPEPGGRPPPGPQQRPPQPRRRAAARARQSRRPRPLPLAGEPAARSRSGCCSRSPSRPATGPASRSRKSTATASSSASTRRRCAPRTARSWPRRCWRRCAAPNRRRRKRASP